MAKIGALVLVGLTAHVALAACSNNPSARETPTQPSLPVSYTVPGDIVPMVLPATGADSRWTQGLDAFGQVVQWAATRECVQSYGLAMPDGPPPGFIRYSQLPDLPYIRRYGFESGTAPLPSADTSKARSASTDPHAEEQCQSRGISARADFKKAFVGLQLQWYQALDGLASQPEVINAFRDFAACLSRKNVHAADEDQFFGIVDKRVQERADPVATTRVQRELGAIYSECMEPVEKVREPLRLELRTGFISNHQRDIQQLRQGLMARIHELEIRYNIKLTFPEL
jgi:hypothetical protein